MQLWMLRHDVTQEPYILVANILNSTYPLYLDVNCKMMKRWMYAKRGNLCNIKTMANRNPWVTYILFHVYLYNPDLSVQGLDRDILTPLKRLSSLDHPLISIVFSGPRYINMAPGKGRPNLYDPIKPVYAAASLIMLFHALTWWS